MIQKKYVSNSLFSNLSLAGLFLFGHGHGHTHSHGVQTKSHNHEEKAEDLGFIEQIKIVSETTKSDFILSVKELNNLKEKSSENDIAGENLLGYNKASTFSSSGSMVDLKKKKKKTRRCQILCKNLRFF